MSATPTVLRRNRSSLAIQLIDATVPWGSARGFAREALRQFPDLCFEADDRLRPNAPSRFCPTGEAEAQELPDARFGVTALLALLTFSLRRLARNPSMPAITRSPARSLRT